MSRDRPEPGFRSPCICYAFEIHIEPKEGDFYDPTNLLPRNAAGRKFRVMHKGCPQHNGFSARTMPTAAQTGALMRCTDAPFGSLDQETDIEARVKADRGST